MSPPASEKGEFARIKKIEDALKRVRPQASSRVIAGIGDDAAVVAAPNGKLILCSDAMVEDIHFDLRWSSAGDLGHKAVASALSDLAATNAKPLHVLISLAIPQNTSDSFLEEFYEASGILAARHDCDIVGGDLSLSPQKIFIDVAAVGESPSPILRSGAKAGDWVGVSGSPGASAAGLYALRHLQNDRSAWEPLVRAHLRPEPRFDLLPDLQKSAGLCTSLIDISDGLSSELHHLARKSNVGFEISEIKIPIHPLADQLARANGLSALDWTFGGGEDYELLATFDSVLIQEFIRAHGRPPQGFTLIGQATEPSQGLVRVTPQGQRLTLALAGHNHFA